MTTNPRFSDVSDHWVKPGILALANRNSVVGYPDGTFRPDAEITRSEFAAVMVQVFPNAQPIRTAIAFSDVPSTHWAAVAVQWAYERGFFAESTNGQFYPEQPIARVQAIAVLVNAFLLTAPPNIEETLRNYFTDAAEIPAWGRNAIASAVQGNLIVNYPKVRTLRPHQSSLRGEVCAWLCRGLKLPNTVPLQYATSYLGIYDITGSIAVPFDRWQGSGRLMRDIQVLLSGFNLYPANEINGEYNWKTEQGLTAFCNFYGLLTMRVGVFDANFAWTLTNADPVDYFLALAQDRATIYQEFLRQEAGYNASHLAFLDRGVDGSPYQAQIKDYPTALTEKPNHQTLLSPGASLALKGSNRTIFFNPFPLPGQIPAIDSTILDFLHADIKQACICVGSYVDGQMQSRWLGRNALDCVQLWSATKFIQLLQVACRASQVAPSRFLRDCLVRSNTSGSGYGFFNLAADLVSYNQTIATSNSIAAMFKQFSTPSDLDGWLKQITGNRYLTFRGGYGEPPFISAPNLWHQPSRQTILNAAGASHNGSNLISTYDLTRCLAMLGWHNYLPEKARLPYARWDHLETIVRATGQDCARYVDVAIDRLSLAPHLRSIVILSKMGFGRSGPRDRTELIYSAFVQFVDQRQKARGKPAVQRSIVLTLSAAKDLNDANQEAVQLDARLAAEVTEILRRVMNQELA